MTTVKDNLISAKALIDTPEKWGKGEYVQGECFCALGALAAAMDIDPISAGLSMSKEYSVLQKAIPTPNHGIWRYNDEDTTTHADIMALFDRAIEATK